jgi:hypothetical protein
LHRFAKYDAEEIHRREQDDRAGAGHGCKVRLVL